MKTVSEQANNKNCINWKREGRQHIGLESEQEWKKLLSTYFDLSNLRYTSYLKTLTLQQTKS